MRYVAETVAALLALLALTCFSVSASPNPPSPTAATTSDFLTVGLKCGLVNGKLVCGDKQGGSKKQGGGKKQDNDDDDDNEKPTKAKKEFSCKKAKCDPGETKLDKPNIYGACCQAGAEPLKHNTKPDEPKKCQFPGEVPPDCNCPPGTEFMGFRGCLPKKAEPDGVPVGPAPKKVPKNVVTCCTGVFPNGEKTAALCGIGEAHLRSQVAKARNLPNADVAPSSITCAPQK